MFNVLPSARLTRLPAMLSTLPPATLTRLPLATFRMLALSVTMETASFGMETLEPAATLTAWSPVVNEVPPLRLRSGAVASSRAVSTLYALPRTFTTAALSVSNTGAAAPG